MRWPKSIDCCHKECHKKQTKGRTTIDFLTGWNAPISKIVLLIKGQIGDTYNAHLHGIHIIHGCCSQKHSDLNDHGLPCPL
jgi:hypothetical protein